MWFCLHSRINTVREWGQCVLHSRTDMLCACVQTKSQVPAEHGAFDRSVSNSMASMVLESECSNGSSRTGEFLCQAPLKTV